jgi:dextranase
MPVNVAIQSIQFSRAFFKPGEPVRWSVTVQSDQQASLKLVTTIRYLAQPAAKLEQPLEFGPGAVKTQFSWQPEPTTPRGYGLDVELIGPSGEILAQRSAGFDVLERWTQHPRYGFLTDFEPNRIDGNKALDWLLNFHINGLQFYDWMYRHDQYLTDEDPYIDPLGRTLSLRTVNQLIESAHDRGMAAMPYTAVYAASIPFYEQHKDWALLQKDGSPHLFGNNFLVIMDPRPGSPWTGHLLAEFDRILEKTEFDGIHLDQYGAPKEGYDAAGNSFPLDQPLADLIDATKAVVTRRRGEDGAVVFNAVTNWPIDTVATSDQDLVYIEVWPPYTSFYSLWQLITQAQKSGGGKPVVLAAYIDPSYETNALINDAIIFASGAGHIELGEQTGYLSDPYFPNFAVLSHSLSTSLQRYYEFAIRYQNCIGPATQSANPQYDGKLEIDGVKTSTTLSSNRVTPIYRTSQDHLAVSLINLVGIETNEWARGTISQPTPLESLKVKINGIKEPVGRVWFATPDQEDFSLQELEFSQSEGVLQFTLPSLHYWDMILLEWSRPE